MPFYDYIYGTMDKSTDTLYETSLQRSEEVPNAVHLTHLTTPDSIYHLRLGFAFLAAKPQNSSSKWYLWLMWPVTLWSMILTWVYGTTFVVERNVLKNLKLQTWAIPKYTIQVRLIVNSFVVDAYTRACLGTTIWRFGIGTKLNLCFNLYFKAWNWSSQIRYIWLSLRGHSFGV